MAWKRSGVRAPYSPPLLLKKPHLTVQIRQVQMNLPATHLIARTSYPPRECGTSPGTLGLGPNFDDLFLEISGFFASYS
jgi:hypothetical protein